jgi:hypothetical protein
MGIRFLCALVVLILIPLSPATRADSWLFANKLISECTKSESPFTLLKKMNCKIAAQQSGTQGKKVIILSCPIKGTKEHLNMAFANSTDLCELLLEKMNESKTEN